MVSNAIDKTKVIVGEDEPENPELNRLWVDTSTIPNLEKRYVGLNIWDEEFESGYYDVSDGSKQSGSSWIRTKNQIPCEPSTTYYFNVTGTYTGTWGAILFYDSNGDLLSYNTTSVANTEFTTPPNCESMTFYVKSGWLDTQISINDHPTLHEYIPYSDSPWMVVNEVDKNPAFTTLQSDFNVAAGKITSIVSEVWPNGDMTASSRIDQTADKISLVVEDGSSVGNVTLTADALSYIGPNISLTQNGDFVGQSSNITANADKIALVVADGSTAGNVTLTADAMSYVGNNVNLQTNNSLNIIVGNIESDITNAANTAQGNAQTYADSVASTISATQDEMKLQIAAQGDVLAVMKLEGDGLWVQTGGENSPYKTLTDGTGFHVYQQDTRIASFANNGITAHSFTMGRVVCRKTSAGGWAWNLTS